jgi:hypothetical protein
VECLDGRGVPGVGAGADPEELQESTQDQLSQES